jgi:N-formylmaleamate deformylase
MANWFSGSAVANGIHIHYHHTGGDKPPLVLSHGLTDNGLCWTRAALVLEEHYDVIMYDARGHGLSDTPATGYGAQERAADLAGFIEALGLSKPYLMGHSMGADTTSLVAADYPNLAGAAILEDPPWREVQPTVAEREVTAAEWRATMLARKSKTIEALPADGRREHPTWDEIEFGPWSQAKRQVSLNVLQGFATMGAGWRDTAARITCPTLLITADPELGGIVTPAAAAAAARLCPALEVAHIQGAGHNIRREGFDQYISAVAAFLAGLER